MSRTLRKASGEEEPFREEKVYESARRAGAKPDEARRAAAAAARAVKKKDNSEHVYRLVRQSLDKSNPAAADRYSLKRAIMSLGPTGYPFEDYVALLLKEQGYTAEVGKITSGRCVRHEVDVTAARDSRQYMIECKYHNSPGTKSGVKTGLYVYARYLDIQAARKSGSRSLQPWLVTNTKVTSTCARYARCAQIKVTSWRGPGESSLEKMIESHHLYPVTIFSLVNKSVWPRLYQAGIVLARDLEKKDTRQVAGMTGLDKRTLKRLRERAKQLRQGTVEATL